VLMIGRPFVEADIGGDDWQLVGTLVNQLQVAAENRRLFAETQSGRETLQSILNSLPAGVIVVDSNSRQITLANRQMTALFGIDSSGHTPTSTLLPSAINPRSPRFAPFRVLNERGNVNETVSIDYGEDDQRTYLVSAAPIYAGDELVAAVAVFTDTTELHLLEVALEENLNEISQTYEASRVLKDQRTPFDVYQTAYHQMLGFTPVEAFYLIRCTPDGTITEMYRNADETTIERIDALPFSPDLLSRSEATRYGGAGMPIPNTGQPPLLSMISQPISLGKDQLMGWMVLGFYSSYVMRGSEENFSGALAVQVAVSLETLRLSDQTQRALTEARTLYSASRAISAAGTLESAAETVREQLLTRFQPDRIDVFIVADRTRPDRIEWKVRYEATPPPARSTLVLENSYISDSDFLTAEPLFLGDVETATEAEQALVHRLPIPEDIRAQASVPLRIKENTLGRVVMSFFAPQQFEESDRQFVQTLVEQAATVVDNALLYRQTNESLEEATALYNASRAVADAQDSNEILNAIVNHAMSPDITRAMLIMLLTLTWDASEAYIEVAADWSRGEIIANMTGMRLTPEDFPAWKQISKPDIMYVDAVMDAETLDDESRLGFETMGIVSFVTVPLQVAGKPLGAFLIASENPHEHTARELRIYKALADQAAITLENRNLLRQTESRARQLETSAQISKAATSTLDLNELLNATVNLIRQSFGYDHAQIFLISDDGKNAELKASTGEAGRRLLEKKHALGVGSASVIGRVTSDGRSYNVMDTADSRQTHKANPELPNTRAELAIPIVARGKTIGALDVQSNIPGAFRTEDERVLESLADQIGVAIENARLFEQSTRRMEEQRFLFNVTRTAASTEIDNSFARITRDIMEQTSSDVVVLLLPDSEKKRMIVNYAAREPARHIIPESLPVEHEMISKMLRTRQPGLYEDNAQGLLFSPDDVPGMRSLVAVPLVGAGEVVGIIAALATRQRAYNAESLQLMATLASTLTAIVQNARLLGDLQEANQRLREVDKLKSQFLANMSHELRTPLNSIIGFSRVILKGIDGPLNDTQSQDLTTIHESGKHLLNLVNDILDQAKIEAGKMELASDYFKLDDMIKSVMSTAVGLVKDKPIRLHQEIQANLPQIYADEFRTRQVLLNILSNAAKFTRQGSITVTAFTVNEAGRDMVQVSVTDTGIGISKENIRRVFAQFEQVDNSTARGAEGTGLGMPIAKSLIEMMGGRIWLESEVGVGSTFNITLPTQQTEGVPANGMPEAVDIPAAAVTELDAQVEQAITLADNPRPLQRIVITIDDEPGMINMYRRYLAKHGFEVIGTTNPNEAADLIVTYQPSVILLDVNMPGRNGWEVLEELKELDETFEYPVIVCSIEDDKARAFRLGAADYLVKPFVEEDLLRALRRVQLERTLPGVLIINPDQEALSRVRPVLTAQEDLLRYLEATSPEQAIDMIENHRPNLVIFDLRSSALDVLPLISHIRRHPGTSGARLLVIPGAQLADDDLVRMAEQNVHFESGLTDDAMMAMVRIQLGLNGHAQS
jgi:signal transduction histidine kinase/DNA-binding response OmpR family regulator/putative methionine-R-sulfoxide reductase with GAF domain